MTVSLEKWHSKLWTVVIAFAVHFAYPDAVTVIA